MHEESEAIVPTKELSKAIKQIAKDTVHKICSGQVVLSLAIAVKELVENSIDAGATIVEVKLRESGLEAIEVSDNGQGVEEQYIEGMTAKYHTSKIQKFDDLRGVQTFGFRGEALSSLCSLSDMIITTRHSSASVGLKIELDHEGKIKNRSPCARQVGTSVFLSNLFATLPVRKRDFSRNIKKEFAKMCYLLQAYCLVSKGVRIICTNQNSKGNKSVIMATHGSLDVMSNIQAVFGTKQTSDLIPIKSPFDSETKLTIQCLTNGLQDSDSSFQITDEDIECLNKGNIQFEGFISSCAHGCGRSSKDRQYYFINSRPCDTKHISKLVNEIYHRFNTHQYPFIFLNIITERSQVDVNLTPDKRQLLLNNEKILLLALKKALLNTFETIPSTFKIQNKSIDSMFQREFNQMTENNESIVKEDEILSYSTQRYANVLSQWKATGDTKGSSALSTVIKRKICNDEIVVRTSKMKKIQDFLKSEPLKKSGEVENLRYKSGSDSDNDDFREVKSLLPTEESTGEENHKELEENTKINCRNVIPYQSQNNLKFFEALPSKGSETNPTERHMESSKPFADCNNYSFTEPIFSSRIETSVCEIKSAVQAEEDLKKDIRLQAINVRFKSEISPSQNEAAESELQREITKDMFSKMEIIGQFNLGFIIVKLDSDLFIVDQHACDEKYNFEMLQRTTTLQSQTLAVPQALDLTSVNELVLIDHLDIFERNGFKFEISENSPPTKKIRLLAKPFSSNWVFGKGDIEELIFMLQDAPAGTFCRPTRVRAMFASKACRKSVMIGTSLNRGTMKKLITHMGEIDQPWNCPHGRPTMRHLINVNMFLTQMK